MEADSESDHEPRARPSDDEDLLLEPVDEELRKFLTDCVCPLQHRVVYCPPLNCLVGTIGSVTLPEAYRSCPMLAIYYAKFRMRKRPFSYLHEGIQWPEPYVVWNTIAKKMQSHPYVRARSTDVIDELKLAIAGDVVVPPGKDNELLEKTPKAEIRSKYL
ncbi:hypothetical protein HG536_0C00160 [Torulaspora globosa]|uniref:Uncharacterized protein n=1 Tax=Torulaspora globosa TaxID=48254 RepID=A0A7G3ZEB3_9SACH|nr:uncharacterized protein HG536_0C00160 [Torulaspora globosa]QLL31849.1 hypothetical protein HG536_0C00160 [Torulaspora globosa]